MLKTVYHTISPNALPHQQAPLNKIAKTIYFSMVLAIFLDSQ